MPVIIQASQAENSAPQGVLCPSQDVQSLLADFLCLFSFILIWVLRVQEGKPNSLKNAKSAKDTGVFSSPSCGA